MVPDFSLGLSPPEMARMIHKVMERRFGNKDIYATIKKESNRKALELYPRLKEKVQSSTDRLLTAVEIAGLYTDYKTGETICTSEVDPTFELIDLNGDCKFDLEDFAEAASRWLDCHLVPATACD